MASRRLGSAFLRQHRSFASSLPCSSSSYHLTSARTTSFRLNSRAFSLSARLSEAQKDTENSNNKKQNSNDNTNNKKDNNKDQDDNENISLEDFIRSQFKKKNDPSSSSRTPPPSSFSDNSRVNKKKGSNDTQENNNKNQSNKDNNENDPDPLSRFLSGGGGGPNGGQNPQGNVNQALIGLLLSYFIYAYFTTDHNRKELTWQSFRSDFLDKGLVKSLTVINRSQVQVTLVKDAPPPVDYDFYRNFRDEIVVSFSIGSVQAFETKLDEAQRELGIPSNERIPVAFHEQISWFNTALSFAPSVLLVAFLYYLSRRAAGGAGGGGPGGGFFSIGKSKAKMFDHESQVKVRFNDVAGMDEAKEEIMEFVNFLKEPEKYTRLGAKIPRGAILSGPPGTGKTLLAKATAGEANVPFLSVSGSEFVEMFVGVGSSRVRDLFANAKKHAPCIIFVDEIDAIGKARGKGGQFGGNDERESTLNQLLVEMDGFGTDEHIVVLAGTNRPDVLDPALLRPGRFDRHIAVERPDVTGRQQIFKVHLRPLVLSMLDAEKKAKAQEEASSSSSSSSDDADNQSNQPSSLVLSGASKTDNSTTQQQQQQQQSTTTSTSTSSSSSSTSTSSSPTSSDSASTKSDDSSSTSATSEESSTEADQNKTKDTKLVDRLAEKLAASTPGFSGADIANICNEAALIAARNSADYVTDAHFDQAIERIIAGLEKKSRILTPDEKTTVAYHEGGHALLGHVLPGADPLVKVSIVPRGRALGYARYNPVERFLYTKEQLFDKMVMTMGGRVAEEIVFGRITTGAQDDLQKITKMATDICANYGMDNEIGRVSYGHGDENAFQKPFSEKTGELLDVQVRQLIQQVHKHATEILTERRSDLDKIAKLLLEREVISREDMINLVGPRPVSDDIDKSLGYGGTKSPDPKPENNPAPEDPLPTPGLAAIRSSDKLPL